MNGAMRIDKHMPVDRVAKRVWMPRHIDDDFNAENLALKRSKGGWWKYPIKGVCIDKSMSNNEDFIDYAGARFFRSTIVNFIGDSSWQLRCSCGNYFKKKVKKIKVGAPVNGICAECLQIYSLRRDREFAIKGFNSKTINEMIESY